MTSEVKSDFIFELSDLITHILWPLTNFHWINLAGMKAKHDPSGFAAGKDWVSLGHSCIGSDDYNLVTLNISEELCLVRPGGVH